MSIRQTYWNKERQEQAAGKPAAARVRYRPTEFKAVVDPENDFTRWFRRHYGYDPITKEPEPRMNANGRE